MRPVLAASVSFDDRMRSMTASMLSTAILRPLEDVHPIAGLAQLEHRRGA
jgi:hypothetical protein